MSFTAISHTAKYIIHYIFIPGLHKLILIRQRTGVINIDECARICLLDRLCAGFHHKNSICYFYSSIFQGRRLIYAPLWSKRPPPIEGKKYRLLNSRFDVKKVNHTEKFTYYTERRNYELNHEGEKKIEIKFIIL